MKEIIRFIKKEIVLFVALLCALFTMLFVPVDAMYIEYIDVRTLCLLWCLMAVVAGIKHVGAFDWLTYQLLNRIKNGKVLSLTLILLPFFCSMFVTNDVALIVFVPFTLALLEQLHLKKAIIPILVLQTIAANLGSMATPVGNPQNLYLYANYNLDILPFFRVVLPLTAISLFGLILGSLPIFEKELPKFNIQKEDIKDTRKLGVYLLLFVLCLLTVFKMVNYGITTLMILVVFILIDKELLPELDYALLFTFVCFFVVSGNLGRIDQICVFLQKLLNESTLLTSIGASQFISNVPSAVLLSNFTNNWQELLAGVNIGGLGTPIASLASLITLKFYMSAKESNILKFLGLFTIANVIGLVILTGYTML
ncbi:MAG: anion transporter [Erysipelotrichaceae bacterium]|nr:anion transporter [Erysipelotrichaceae bacterium]